MVVTSHSLSSCQDFEFFLWQLEVFDTRTESDKFLYKVREDRGELVGIGLQGKFSGRSVLEKNNLAADIWQFDSS